MSGRYYKGRYFTVYMTANGLMDKVNQHCQKYGLSYSKFAQTAITEKLEREKGKLIQSDDNDNDGAKGVQATTLATPTAPAPSPEVVVIDVTTQYPTATASLSNGGMYGGMRLGG